MVDQHASRRSVLFFATMQAPWNWNDEGIARCVLATSVTAGVLPY